jgi:PAS domain S-box-containing protein
MPVRRSSKSLATLKTAAPSRPPKPRRSLIRPGSLSSNTDRLTKAVLAYHEEILTQNEQLRETQLELERSHDLYARLYEQAPVGLLTLDRNGVIEKANLTALGLVGASREAVIHRPLLVFVHEDDRAIFLNFLLSARGYVGQNKPWVDIRLRRLAGGQSHVQLAAVGVGRDSGKGIAYLTAITDLSRRVQFEEERRRSEQRVAEAMNQRAIAQAANEAKDRFLAMLSHELRTPLTPALLCISAMAQDPAYTESVRDDLNSVLNNLHLEVRLIDDLLDLSRILGGKLHRELHHLDLRDVVRQAVEICHPALQARRLELSPDFYSLPVPLSGDRARLIQVFWNVLRNAVKFTPDGGTISLHIIRTAERVRIRITDTGVGIAPEVLPRIFDAFEQGGDIVTRRFGGLGLGLTISKSIVEAHSGTIDVRSEGTDLGTTVTVSLPLDDGSHVENSPSHMVPAPLPQTTRRPLRILVVEDHNETRAAITILLQQRGYELVSVSDARQATDAASQKTFDLVISDLGLPGSSGYDLMTQLRADHKLKGIALSGFGSENDQKLSKDAGFQMHIVKPITLEALEQAIYSIFAS